jgi:hypothetical protein
MTDIQENHEFMADGRVDINDPQVLVALNASLAEATMSASITPYTAWSRVRKVLAIYHIHIPNPLLRGSDGNQVIPISQFGNKFGQTNDGDTVVNDTSPFSLYFEWEMDDRGLFKIFAEIVNQDDLEEILDDYGSEVEEVNEAYDKKELAIGAKDEREEHNLNKKESLKVAKDHLRKVDKHYYSKLGKIGLEEMKIDPKVMQKVIDRRKKKAYSGKDPKKNAANIELMKKLMSARDKIMDKHYPESSDKEWRDDMQKREDERFNRK